MSCPPRVPASGIAARSAAVLAGAVLVLGLGPGVAVALSAGELVTDVEDVRAGAGALLQGADELLSDAEAAVPAGDDLLPGEDGLPAGVGSLLEQPLEQVPAAVEQATGAIEQTVEALPLPEDPPLLGVVTPSSQLRLSGAGVVEPAPVQPAEGADVEGAPAIGNPSAEAAIEPSPPTGGPVPAVGPLVAEPTRTGPPPVAAATGVGVQAAGLEPLGLIAADAARQFTLPLLVMVAVLVFLAAGGQLAPHDRKALARSFDDAGRGFS